MGRQAGRAGVGRASGVAHLLEPLARHTSAAQARFWIRNEGCRAGVGADTGARAYLPSDFRSEYADCAALVALIEFPARMSFHLLTSVASWSLGIMPGPAYSRSL